MAKKEKSFAVWAGVLFLIIGTFVVFNDKIFLWNYFGANVALGVFYVFLGSIGVYVGTKKESVFYSQAIGFITIVLSIIGFIPKINSFLIEAFKINTLTNLFHFAIGLSALYIYRKK